MVYYDCFLKTVLKLADFAAHFIPRDKVRFMFDRHRETQYNAALLYDWIAGYKPEALESLNFTDRREPGIQAADLWAREFMKRCDTHLFDDRARTRLQWNILARTRRFQFHLTLGRQLAQTLEETPELPSFNHPDYERWRDSRKLTDNLSNRFRYVSSIERDDEGAKGVAY